MKINIFWCYFKIKNSISSSQSHFIKHIVHNLKSKSTHLKWTIWCTKTEKKTQLNDMVGKSRAKGAVPPTTRGLVPQSSVRVLRRPVCPEVHAVLSIWGGSRLWGWLCDDSVVAVEGCVVWCGARGCYPTVRHPRVIWASIEVGGGVASRREAHGRL